MAARKILDAVTTTGAGTSIRMFKTPRHTIHMEFTDVTGAISALTVRLEGSLNGDFTKAINLTSPDHVWTAAELAAKAADIFINNELISFIRANVITATTSGTYQINAWYVGDSGYE